MLGATRGGYLTYAWASTSSSTSFGAFSFFSLGAMVSRGSPGLLSIGLCDQIKTYMYVGNQDRDLEVIVRVDYNSLATCPGGVVSVT